MIDKEFESNGKSRTRFLILDDSLIPKTGTRIEFIGKVFDHSSHTYKLGMKILTLGFCDSKTFLPIDFSLHNEPGKTKKRGLKRKELNNQYTKKRSTKEPSNKRIAEIEKVKY